jgi:hypothetical protein
MLLIIALLVVRCHGGLSLDSSVSLSLYSDFPWQVPDAITDGSFRIVDICGDARLFDCCDLQRYHPSTFRRLLVSTPHYNGNDSVLVWVRHQR